MKIYIELVIILVLMSVFIIWRVWFDKSKKKILKNYNPELNESKKYENDKNAKGGIFEDKGTGNGTGDTESKSESVSSIGPEQPEGRELLQKATVSDARKNSTSPGKDSSNVRTRFFRRYKRK